MRLHASINIARGVQMMMVIYTILRNGLVILVTLLGFSSPALANLYEVTVMGTVNQFSDIGIHGETVTVLMRYETIGGPLGYSQEVNDQWAYAVYFPHDSTVTANGSVSGNLPIGQLASIYIHDNLGGPDVWEYSLRISPNSIQQNAITLLNYSGSEFSRPLSTSLDYSHDIFFSQANNPDVWSISQYAYLPTADGSGNYIDLNTTGWSITAVPVPGTMLLFGPAIAGLVLLRRKFKV